MPESLGLGPSLWVAIGVGVLVAALFLRSRLNYLALPRLPRGSAKAPLDCMVVIPARNEEAFIARAVRSLPPDSVIVVDDHSEDRTAEEARRAGAGVLKAPDLRRGAAGKASACQAGARALTSRWILFADADTRFAPGFLDAAVACAEAGRFTLLSIHLDSHCETFAERVLAPYLIALFFCGASPRRDVRTVFNGQCLLVRRDGYEFMGGHASALNDIAEDVRMAAAAERHRLKSGVVRAAGLGRVRWRGIAQTAERGARRFMIVSPWMGVGILIAALAMAAWPPALIWLIAQHRTAPALALGALPFVLLSGWYWSSGRGFSFLSILTLPIAIYLTLPIVWRGFLGAMLGRPVEWKGRVIGS